MARPAPLVTDEDEADEGDEEVGGWAFHLPRIVTSPAKGASTRDLTASACPGCATSNPEIGCCAAGGRPSAVALAAGQCSMSLCRVCEAEALVSREQARTHGAEPAPLEYLRGSPLASRVAPEVLWLAGQAVAARRRRQAQRTQQRRSRWKVK